MQKRRLLKFLACVAILATMLPSLGSHRVAHADAGAMSMSSASGAAASTVTVTFSNTSYDCPFVDWQSCTYDVHWGSPDGPTLCSFTVRTPNDNTSCDGEIPVSPMGTYTAYVMPGYYCQGCSGPEDSATFTVNVEAPPGTYDSGMGSTSYNPGESYPRTADQPDPNANDDDDGSVPDPTAIYNGNSSATVSADASAPTCAAGVYTKRGYLKFRLGSDGRFYWHFILNKATTAALGLPVKMTMPFAAVNGMAINPPYTDHEKLDPAYDYHASMKTYQIIGDGSRTIHAGDLITFYWYFTGPGANGKGAEGGQAAICRVPNPS